MEPTDAELIRALNSGNRDRAANAVNYLSRAHGPLFEAYAMTRWPTVQDAQDAVPETLSLGLSHLRQIEPAQCRIAEVVTLRLSVS